MPKKSVFIVYATESSDLTTEFVGRFIVHNPDFDVWHDQKAYSNNIHDQLIGYAEKCDIALILASPRLKDKDHYSNRKEIPVLVNRRKENDVVIVGVLLSDFDYVEWNKEGEIPFLQVRFGEFRKARRSDTYGTAANNEFAIYDMLDDSDKNTYHKKLTSWIKSNLKSNLKKKLISKAYLTY